MKSESQLQHKSEKNTHALNETCSMTLFCFDLVFLLPYVQCIKSTAF